MLSQFDVIVLNDLVTACANEERVTVDKDDWDNPINGTARSIDKYSDDVRDGEMRVTTQGGFEAWFPVKSFLDGTLDFYIRDWRNN